ncbi:S8 family peptidase [Halobacteriovorax sp. GB3]|uniref:S8 family peptidase n=1 Tax=Halobacteriovorax sp. GB3 TaxID=2719615 RepID=UPI0023608F1B|nr:S8 family peptidase [Halobacteriovorax sp. GB3]MDD0853886.1 S8 family peptidase [Halobacteriovorax sp. GB3]
MIKGMISSFALLCAGTTLANTSFVHPNEIIVSFKNGDQLESLSSAVVDRKWITKKVSHISLAQFLDQDKVIEEIKKDPNVEWVLPNIIYLGNYMESLPTGGQIPLQYHHRTIGSFDSWTHFQGKQDIIVAVTDDGFFLEHEDMENSWYKNPNEIPENGIDDDQNGYVDDVIGYDFNNDDNDPSSNWDHGTHGTHVAGIIGANPRNNLGGAGIAPRVKVMPLKFYGEKSLSSAMYFKAYAYAADNGAKIINTSYNIDPLVEDQVYLKAIEYARSKGLLIFNSAGNTRTLNPKRGSLEQLLLVASSNEDDRVSSFSNYGEGIDLIAPGEKIYSIVKNNRYGPLSGTSMASPMAAGVAAYIWSENPDWSSLEVAHVLLSMTEKIDEKNKSRYQGNIGSGRLVSYRDEVSLSSIRNIVWDKKESTVKIFLKGLIVNSKEEIKDALSLTNRGVDVDFEIEFKSDVGANVITLKVPEDKGRYQLDIDGSKLENPFFERLDADEDGRAGGVRSFLYKIGWF